MMQRLKRAFLWRLVRARAAAGALEFAIVAGPFVLFLLFIAELAYDFFAQVALDYGVQAAARQIQVGNGQSLTTASAFMTTYLCPAVSVLLSCSSLSVNVIPIATDYYTNGSTTVPVNAATGKLDTSGYQYCPGKPNQLMLVQALYTSPSIVGLFFPAMTTMSGSSYVRATISTTAFINENFPLTSAAPAGC